MNESPGATDDATTGGARSAGATAAWPPALIDALRGDRRIVGAADVTEESFRGHDFRTTKFARLVLVTTWDGLEPIAADLPRFGVLALGGDPLAVTRGANEWSGVGPGPRRVDLRVVRIGDLKPSKHGETASAVLDPKGLIGQWIRWSVGRDRSKDPPRERGRRRPLALASAVEEFETLPPGQATTLVHGVPVLARRRLAEFLRAGRGALRPEHREDAALMARIDATLAASPEPGAGLRVVPADDGPAAALESFLAVADGEGFLGDRVLFAEAVKRLGEMSRRTPVFDEGFVLPTFDAVEARWRIGEATGGCKTPLVPGVVVGVGVTPADALEFWAAPFVREPDATVACVADPGTRLVRERTVGKDALVAACVGEVERAWDELPEFLRTARRAGRTPAGDTESALRPLHLPRSYREAAKRQVGRLLTPSRLQVALALARSGEGEEPLNARKFGLAAGRLLAETPAASAPAPTCG